MKERAEQLRAQFEAIDTDGTGMIDAGELTKALKQHGVLGLGEGDEGINAIVGEVDFYGNGLINYSEFIAAILSVE